MHLSEIQITTTGKSFANTEKGTLTFTKLNSVPSYYKGEPAPSVRGQGTSQPKWNKELSHVQGNQNLCFTLMYMQKNKQTKYS